MVRIRALQFAAGAGFALLSSPALAQSGPAPAAVAPEMQIASLRQELIDAQQEIVRLRVLAQNQGEQETRLSQCKARNERLIGIGDELIAAYGQRYRKGAYFPFDDGRRAFETELQAMGDRVYDNRIDAGPHREPPAKPVEKGASGAGTAASPRDTAGSDQHER